MVSEDVSKAMVSSLRAQEMWGLASWHTFSSVSLPGAVDWPPAGMSQCLNAGQLSWCC